MKSPLSLGLLFGLLALSACASTTASVARPSPSGLSPPATSSSPAARRTPAPGAAGSPAFSPVPGAGIARVELTTALAPDGSAQSPSTSFDHTKDRKIIAVLTLAGLGPGTSVSFDRYLNGNHADSKSATLPRKERFFYFNFIARPGTTLVVGHYRLRFYVSGHAVQEVTYLVQ